MATVRDLLKRTLSLVGVVTEGQLPTNEQYVLALDALNDMFAEWYGKGIYINDGDLTLNDDFPTDPEDARGARFNLAVEIAPEFEREVLQTVYATANETFRQLGVKYMTVPEAELDSALLTNGTFNIITGQ